MTESEEPFDASFLKDLADIIKNKTLCRPCASALATMQDFLRLFSLGETSWIVFLLRLTITNQRTAR
jgi:hypothetical protein